MTLGSPPVDDRSFDDLVAEARALIPAYAPEWTNHNPSDPGITLLELFAWLAEMLVYRSNQIPERHVGVFLRLLQGPAWTPGGDLDDEVSKAISALRRRTTAVTRADYEALALEASPQVGRARCVPGRYLAGGTEAERTDPRPGHVSVVVVPRSALGASDAAKLRASVAGYLEPYRLVTTRLTVADPVWAPVSVEALVTRQPDVPEPLLRSSVAARLERFLDPLLGGPHGDGWPFGRGVYVAELYEQLDALPEVDYVADLSLTSTCGAQPRCAEAAPLWTEKGELIGLELGSHHLVAAEIDPTLVISSTRLVPVEIAVRATAAQGRRGPAAIAAIKQALRFFFRPGHGWPPTAAGPWLIGADVLRTVVAALPEVASVQPIALEGEAGRVTYVGGVPRVRVEEGELADVDVEVTLD